MAGGGRPLLPEILGQADHIGAKLDPKLPAYRSIFAPSASAVAPSEKQLN